MKNLILIITLLLCCKGFTQSYITPITIKSKINNGAVLVEFTTSFAHKFNDYGKLHHCNYYRANIEKYPSLKSKYKYKGYYFNKRTNLHNLK